MIEVELKAGDVFTWQNYLLFTNESKSQRWFLYLGNQTVEAIVYQITTTTQYQHYVDGGDRTQNNYFKIPAGIARLTKESVLDLSFFETVYESLFNKCRADIEKTGSLTQD